MKPESLFINMSKKHFFQFKEFSIEQEFTAAKVGLDGVLLGAWTDAANFKRILDIGTGTGLLALMMAQKSDGLIDAIEINEPAYREAKWNIGESKWNSRIHLFHNSFQEFADTINQKYDLIICNPPFHKEDSRSGNKERDVARSSSSLELNQLLSLSKKIMHANSRMSFIYPYSRMNEIKESCREFQIYLSRVCYVKSKPEKIIHRVLVELSLQKKSLFESQIIIENEEHLDYTEEFRELTRDFYLGF